MYTYTIQAPCQTKYTIRTNCPALGRSLALKHGKYLCSQESCSDNIITALKEHDTFQILFNNKHIDKILEINCNFPLPIIEDIMYDHRQYDANIFAIHGAAVEYNKEAYLFIAATTSGKTTLTAYLTANGLGYLTDDCILLDQNKFTISPFNTPLHLRDGGYEVLKKLNLLPESLELLDDISFKRYVYTPDNCIDKPLPLKRIFFITRTESENCLVEMNTTERITSLLKSPIKEYKPDGRLLQFLSRLSKIPCHTLHYCDMNYVLEVITGEQ